MWFYHSAEIQSTFSTAPTKWASTGSIFTGTTTSSPSEPWANGDEAALYKPSGLENWSLATGCSLELFVLDRNTWNHVSVIK